ncbi:MAG: M36 family metallopeptidase [Vicinamibacterales bacterium]
MSFVRRPFQRWSHSWLIALLVLAAAAAAPRGAGQAPAPGLASPDAYPNFDIRYPEPGAEKDAGAAAYLDAFAPAPAADRLASQRDAAAALRSATPGALVESDALGGVQVVSAMPGTAFLSESAGSNETTLRAFLDRHAAAYGLDGGQGGQLVVVADYVNPGGNLAWVELEQRLNGIPVFQGHVRGAFTPKGELARTNGLLATGLGAAPAAAPALSAADAITLAAARVGLTAEAAALVQKPNEGATLVFERGSMADEPRAWLVYFPLAPGVVRLAWATEVFGDPLAFLTVVDAQTGTMLFRKNLTAFQTQAATYHVYTGDSPAPSSPTPALPGMNYQAPIVSRTAVTRIGNEAPYTFNNLGWITDNTNGVNGWTDGNNVEAGIDRNGTDGVDAPVAGTNRVFNFAYNPAPGNPAPGDDPLTAAFQAGDVTNMFYWVNRYHDETYLYGFNEVSRNFQNDNFGRGGTGGDRVRAEGQDSSGTNNANFSTPADGGRGRMQMYIWTGPTPDRSGDLDREVVVHELTHGLSNRLHANATGLGSNMSGGLGEGWSDFFAKALFATAAEPVNGVYAMGGYATDEISPGYENYYYGIRRFPMTIMSSVGSNGRPHNPLTFADIDQTQADLTDGAYPAGTVGSTIRDQVHEAGQIWANMLWEVRARFITRLGFTEGNRRILQFVTDGMKMDPVNPTFLSARDAILAAAAAGGGTAADTADIWDGFARRGLGVTATITVNGSGGSTRVVESFLRPGDPVPTFTVNDVTASEGNAGTTTFAFTVSLANPSAGTATVAYATAAGTATPTSGSPVGTSGALTLPAGAPGTTSGAASPYPATINVAGVSGTITRLSVRLNGLTHTFPSDLDMLLVGPGGQRAMFMSDVGGGGDVSNLTLTFDDGAPAPSSSQLVAGTFAPTDASPGDAMNAPAPAGPYGSALSTFNGTSPNGTWSLYVMDDAGSDTGSLTSFTLIMATTTSSGDFTPTSGVLSFPPGTTSLPVNVSVIGDAVPEPSESFLVNLSSPTGAVIGDGQGTGLILNDDGTIPTATNDAYNATVNTPLVVAAPGVLGNDNANGLGALSAVLVTPPSHGGVTLAGNGGFTYTPTGGYTGGDSFTYRATAAGGASSGVATVSLTVSAVTTVQPPINVYVSSVVGNRATIRWTPPLAGPAPTGYVFEGGLAPGQVLASLPLGNVPVFTLDVPTGSFFIRVRSVAGATTSGVSNEVPLHVNVPVPPSAPAPLLGLANGSTLSLSWRNTFGGGAGTSNVLDVSGAVVASLPLGLTESFAFAGVPPGTYTFRVRQVNAAGTSAASSPVTLTFPGGCAGAPQVPTQFLAYRVGSTLYLLWEPPAAGPAISSYVLNVTGAVTVSVPLGGTSLSTPVPPGTYNFTLRAANACGVGPATAVKTVAIP